jgi:hypothetical protein
VGEALVVVARDQEERDRTSYWSDVVEEARNLPRSPRSDPAYYRRLLNLFEILDATHKQPIVELMRALEDAGRPIARATLSTQLQKAKALAKRV